MEVGQAEISIPWVRGLSNSSRPRVIWSGVGVEVGRVDELMQSQKRGTTGRSTRS